MIMNIEHQVEANCNMANESVVFVISHNCNYETGVFVPANDWYTSSIALEPAFG